MAVVPVFFAPDLITAWRENPGCLTAINAFAPLQSGAYGSIGTTNYFGSSTLTGEDHRNAYMFRLQSGNVLFLTGRETTIDKYDNAGTRTNIGSGYSNSAWSMAAWGDLIIATNLNDPPQMSSGGAAFSALTGSPPAAFRVAANQNFVMFGCISGVPDQVFWSGFQNPLQWTPSIATQCGNQRLLDTPGPITDLVAYRDKFIAFKRNSMYVGEYIGPPYVWGWRVVSTGIGSVGSSSVAECDGKLYFFSASGFYEFDGVTLRNIGTPVAQTFLTEYGHIAETINGYSGPGAAYTFPGLLLTQATVDDIDGIVWWRAFYQRNSDSSIYNILYGYNVRTGKWGRHALFTGAVGNSTRGSALVRAKSADIRDFLATDTYSRILTIWNATAGSTLRAMRYPYATSDSNASQFATGVYGNVPGSQYLSRIRLRHLRGTSALGTSDVAAIHTGYVDESETVAVGSIGTGTWNPTNYSIDMTTDAEFVIPNVGYAVGEKVTLAGIELEAQKSGFR